LNILITGGSGFVGSHVIEKLLMTQYNISAILSNQLNNYDSINIIQGNLNLTDENKEQIAQFKPDVIIHLAWEGIPNFSFDLCRGNLNMAINFFDWLIENTNCKKIIVSGTCFEYGKQQGVCMESDSVKIKNYFTWAKNSLNMYLNIKCLKEKILLYWFRIFYVYGPRQREGSLIPTLIKSIDSSQTPNIKAPLNKNDFVYVEDVANAFVKSINADLPSGIYNLGSGTSTSVDNISRIVNMHLKGNQNISDAILKNGLQTETINFWADTNKTRKSLDMEFDTNLNNGIDKLIQSMN